jgi:hypothetical protein
MLFCLLTLAIAIATVAQAQTPADPPAPSQFATAKTAFLSFTGAPASPQSAQETIRAVYGSFYRALVADGYYKLTRAPADAELAFELSILQKGNEIQIQIRDMKTRAVLWTITQRVEPTWGKTTALKNLDQASTHLITDLNTLISGKLP